MQIGVIGINHKLANLELREVLARICQSRFGPNNTLTLNDAFITLSTCNRTEVYFSSDDLSETHGQILNILKNDLVEPFEQKLYTFFHRDCFTHLAKVTTGLDSAIPGETEIQGQVKTAYEQTATKRRLPKELHYLFQKCLHIGKKIRTTFDFTAPRFENALYTTALTELNCLDDKKILFVGASEINENAISYLKLRKVPHITLCNRTLKKSEALAKKYALHILPWKDLSLWNIYDWVIFGTKSPTPLLTPSNLPHAPSPTLLFDLSVPRNIDPCIAHPHLNLWNIDQLNETLTSPRSDLKHAEALLQSFAARHLTRFHSQHIKSYRAIA